MKELFYKIELKITNRYSGNGIIKLNDNGFEGFISLDYIYGLYTGKYLCILLLQYDFVEHQTSQSRFAIKMEEFELPCEFLIPGKDTEALFNFKEKALITNKEFSSKLHEVRKHFFSD